MLGVAAANESLAVAPSSFPSLGAMIITPGTQTRASLAWAVLINTSESMEREASELIRVVVVHTFRIGPHTRENFGEGKCFS